MYKSKKPWLFAFAIAGFTVPALITALGAVVAAFHIPLDHPGIIKPLIKGLTTLWFSLFLLQGADSQRDLAIWWIPCVAVNVGLYCLIGLIAWQSWRRPKFSSFVLLAGCISFALISYLVGWWGQPVLWQFPEGYRGWVVVQWGDPNCPPLASKGLYKVILINTVGRLCTSSQMPTGFRYLRFEYINPNGAEQVMLSGWFRFLDFHGPQFFSMGAVYNLRRQMLFVGTDQERRQRIGELPWLAP